LKQVDGNVMNDPKTKYWYHDTTKKKYNIAKYNKIYFNFILNYKQDKHVLVHRMDQVQIYAMNVN
jgi:hypothetical protein